MGDNEQCKPIIWVGSSKKDLLDMPQEVIGDFGHGLYEAQIGLMPDIGKVLKGFGGVSVIELVLDEREGTFRAVYTVRFKEVIAVLHVFQKKSKKGIETPKHEIDLIYARLKRAEELYEQWKKAKRKSYG